MISKFTADTWHQVDIIVNWNLQQDVLDDQEIKIYIDNEFKEKTLFFNNQILKLGSDPVHNRIEYANALILYGLSPSGSSRFKDIEICIK